MNWSEEEFQDFIAEKTGQAKKEDPEKKRKYNNKKITIDGVEFDSRDESLYYLHLKALKEKGLIKKFELQPKYTLIPKFQYQGQNRRAMTYAPDFKVTDAEDNVTVIDVKSMGTATQQGELRRKLFEFYYSDENLVWLCRNLKHGDQYGWIKYEDLKRIYRDNKKKNNSGGK